MPTRPWIGFRIEVDSRGSAQISDFARWLSASSAGPLFGRWFYLWYSDGGLHLRVRLQPRRGVDASALETGLRQFAADAGATFVASRQTYDRTALAFGETRESVLAELLHTATSDLALQLLAHPVERKSTEAVWLLASAAAGALVQRAIDAEHAAAFCDAWERFAVRTARGDVVESSVERAMARERALAKMLPRVAQALDANPAARKSVRLLRRLCGRGDRGQFVAMHGLHFFCNEMGLSIQREVLLTTALRAVVFPTSSLHISVHEARPTP